jgi:hypothetical protein
MKRRDEKNVGIHGYRWMRNYVAAARLLLP